MSNQQNELGIWCFDIMAQTIKSLRLAKQIKRLSYGLIIGMVGLAGGIASLIQLTSPAQWLIDVIFLILLGGSIAGIYLRRNYKSVIKRLEQLEQQVESVREMMSTSGRDNRSEIQKQIMDLLQQIPIFPERV